MAKDTLSARKEAVKDFLKKIKLNEDTISNILGVVAVLLVIYLLWGYFSNINKGTISSLNTEATASAQIKENLKEIDREELPVEYVVQSGDNLWKIAETVYGSGYEWTKIWQENKEIIKNPSVIGTGTQITLPEMDKSETTATEAYTVVKGDNLWKISEKVCGSGYNWTRIATDNHLANPGLIHSGNRLIINCK